MRALMIARFHGDLDELTRAYDRAHRVIMQAGGAPGELRHLCGVGEETGPSSATLRLVSREPLRAPAS